MFSLILKGICTYSVHIFIYEIFFLLGSVLAEAVGVFFFIREDAAHKRVDHYFLQLVDLNKIGDLLAICDTFQSESDRVEYKKKVIEVFL